MKTTISTPRPTTFWLVSIFLIIASCTGTKKITQKPHESSDPNSTTREIQILGYKKKQLEMGEFIFPACCICVKNEGCPCRCPAIDGIKISQGDILETFDLNLTDGTNKLSLFTIKTNDSKTLKEVNSYGWVGYLHNEIISIVLERMESKIRGWKNINQKPSQEVISKTVETILLEIYKEIGFSGKYLTLAKKLTLEAQVNSRNVNNSKFSGFIKIFNRIDNGAASSEIALEADTEESKLNSSLEVNSDVFIQSKAAYSLLRASNSYWVKSKIESLYALYTDKPVPNESVANKAGRAIIKEDAKGAVGGAVGGAAAGAAVGGVGAVPGAITGAVVGGTAVLQLRLLAS